MWCQSCASLPLHSVTFSCRVGLAGRSNPGVLLLFSWRGDNDSTWKLQQVQNQLLQVLGNWQNYLSIYFLIGTVFDLSSNVIQNSCHSRTFVKSLFRLPQCWHFSVFPWWQKYQPEILSKKMYPLTNFRQSLVNSCMLEIVNATQILKMLAKLQLPEKSAQKMSVLLIFLNK